MSGIAAGVIEKSGSWFSHGSNRLGQGREKARQFLQENKDIAAAVHEAVMAHNGLTPVGTPKTEAVEDPVEVGSDA